MDRDAGEISELAQNRLAIGVGYSANALRRRRRYNWCWRGAQHDQLEQLSSSGVTKARHYLTRSHAVGEFVETAVCTLAGGYPSTGQPYQCRGNSPEEVYCYQAGRHNARYRAGTFLWALILRAAAVILAQMWGNTGSVRHLRG